MNLTNFLPKIAKQYLPLLNREICKKLEMVHIENPNYAAFVMTAVDNEARVSLCAFDANDRCEQIIWTESAEKLLNALISKL